MGVNKIAFGETTLIDLTSDTVASSYLASGYTAHDRTGSVITGTMPTPEGTLSITSNGTYDVSQYASAMVDVAGGGDSGNNADFLMAVQGFPSEHVESPHYIFSDTSITRIRSTAFMNFQPYLNGMSVTFNLPNVTTIESCAFQHASIQSVNMPNLTMISSLAFSSATISGSFYAPKVSRIDSSVFYGTKNITALSFSELTDPLGIAAFTNMPNLQYLNLGQVESLPTSMAQSCSRLSEVVISNASIIGSAAFFDCSALTRVVGDRIKSIGSRAFCSCVQLSEINLDTVVSISGLAFQSCYSLTSVHAPMLLSMDGSAFAFCSLLTDFSAPKLTRIAENAFLGDTALSNVSTPNAEGVGWGAFSNCTSLTHISLPNVEYISASAFMRCKSLEQVQIPKCYSIGSYVFMYCENLSSITLSSTMSITIGMSAFNQCYSLSYWNTPGVTHIESYAFSACLRLSKIDLTNLISLGSGAFAGTAISELYLPAYSATLLSVYLGGMSQLRSFNAPLTSQIGAAAFTLVSSTIEYVSAPAATNIQTSAFAKCTKLQSAHFNAARTINQYAFSGCTSLSDISFEQVSYIGTAAFSSCALTSAIFPAVSSLGSSVFAGCPLSYLELPALSSLVVSFPFAGINKEFTLSLPAMTIMPSISFSRVRQHPYIKTLVLSAVETISAYAFASCYRLTTLDLRAVSSVPTLVNTAFYSTPISTYSIVAGQYGSIIVPASLYASFTTAAVWSTYSSRMVSV